MAGFAVILMMWHHLFNFPDRLDEGVIWQTSLGFIGQASTELLALGSLSTYMWFQHGIFHTGKLYAAIHILGKRADTHPDCMYGFSSARRMAYRASPSHN